MVEKFFLIGLTIAGFVSGLVYTLLADITWDFVKFQPLAIEVPSLGYLIAGCITAALSCLAILTMLGKSNEGNDTVTN